MISAMLPASTIPINKEVRMNDQIHVVAYGRNSSDQQETSQAIQGDEFAIFVNDLSHQILGKPATIIHNYADHGRTASKKKQLAKRHDFNRMLADMEAGTIQQTGQPFPKFVVVLNTSRFSRLHPADTLKLYCQLREANVRLVSIEDRKIFDPDEFNDLLQILVKSQQDNQYAKTVAHNILRGMKHANSKGKNTTSTPPVGMFRLIVDKLGNEKVIGRTTKYRCGEDEDSYLIPGDEVEQQIDNYIFDKFIAEDISYSALARHMNNHDDHHYRLGPNGNGWSQQTIMGLLKNHHLAGWEFIGKKRTDGHATLDNGIVTPANQAINPPDPILTDVTLPNVGHPKQGCVIDRDKFLKAIKIAESRSNNKRRCCNQEYPLTGILRCQCGGPLYAAKERSGVVRYSCARARKKLIEHDCGWWSVKQHEVLPAIMQLIDGEVWKQSHQQPPQPQPQHDDRIKRLESINRKIDNLRNKIKSSDDDAIDILTDALNDAVIKRRQLIQQRPTTNQHIQQDMIDRWHELIEPMLVTVPTVKPNRTFNRIKSLFPTWDKGQIRQLADEGDRLFNLASVQPSRIRQVLNDAGITVQFTFKPSEPPTGGKKRRSWAIDRAKVTMGTDQFNLEQDKPCSAGTRERLTTSGTLARVLRCNRWFPAIWFWDQPRQFSHRKRG